MSLKAYGRAAPADEASTRALNFSYGFDYRHLQIKVLGRQLVI
jgi:hypothetical protein